MNEHVLEQLDDYVDGSLDAASAEQVRLHLAGCAQCRVQERQLRSLLAAASGLPDSIEPPPEVWQGVRLRTIERGRQRRTALWGMRYHLATAALLLIVLSSGATLLLMRGGHPAERSVAVQATGAALTAAEQEYVRTANELEARLAARGADIDTVTVRVVRENLLIIDQAIAEARNALARDPQNPNLGRLISTNYKRKIQVLERTLRLSAQS